MDERHAFLTSLCFVYAFRILVTKEGPLFNDSPVVKAYAGIRSRFTIDLVTRFYTMPRMNESANKPGGEFLQIRAWVWGVALLCLALVGVILMVQKETGTESVSAPNDPALSDSRETELPALPSTEAPVFPPDSPDPLPPPAKRPPSAEEMEYAEFTFEDNLTVILPSHASLGRISVERYDSEGNPTGEPLKSGTQVQIPNPNKPGERIYFRVP